MLPRKTLVTGVKTDLEKLIKRFTKTDSVRYELFAEIWRDMKMNFLCAGRQTEREAREFMELVFVMTTNMWFPPFSFQSRVCALYLLYGLYSTQPCRPRVKIRMLQSQWSEVKNFMKTVDEQHHLDVSFVLHKLRTMNAFHFVATIHEYKPKSKEFEPDPEDPKYTTKDVEQEDNIRDTVSAELLQQMETLHSQYNSMKCLLAGPGAAQPDRSLNLLNDNIVFSIKNILQQFETKRRTRSRNTKYTSEEESSESDIEHIMRESDSVGSKRKRIRDRAYEQVGKSSKFDTPDRVVTAAVPGNKGKGNGKGKGKGKGRPSKTKKNKIASGMFDSEEEYFPFNVTAQGDVDMTGESGTMLHMPTLVEEPVPKAVTTNSQAEETAKVIPKTSGKPKSPAKQRKRKASSKMKVKISPPKKVTQMLSSPSQTKISAKKKQKTKNKK